MRNCSTDDSSSTSLVVLGCTARNLNALRHTGVWLQLAAWYAQDIHTGNEVDVNNIPRVNPQVLLHIPWYISHSRTDTH